MVTAVDLPPRTVWARKRRSATEGDVLATFAGGLFATLAAAIVWLVRRVHFAVPVAITLTLAPVPDMQETMPVAVSAPVAASRETPAPGSTQPAMDQGIVVKMAPRPINRSKPLAFKVGPVRTPSRVPAPPTPVTAPTTPNDLAKLYMKVGNALKVAGQSDPTATRELWSRYRWININDALQTASKRAATAELLDKLLVAATALST